MSTADNGWQGIRQHEIMLRGLDSSAVTLIADTVLAGPNSLHIHAAIGFGARIAVENLYHPFRHQLSGGCYQDLAAYCEAVSALREGGNSEAKFAMERLEFAIYWHQWGARRALCVEGTCSSDCVAASMRKRKQKIGDQLLDRHEAAYSLRFAFETSDAGYYLGHFQGGIDSLLAYLASTAEQA